MKTAPLLMLVGFVAGCGTMPSQVEFPTNAVTRETANPAEKNYKVKDHLLSDYKEGDTTLVVERTYNGMMAQIKAHLVLWDNESRNLYRGVDGLSNTQFAGVTLGGIGALADRIGAATVGAVIAGGAGIWGNRYKLEVQAANYRTAADSMQCIHTQIEKVPRAFWNAYYVDGQSGLRFDTEFFRQRSGEMAKGDEAQDIIEGYDTLVSLHQKVHDAIEAVRKKLFTAQMNTKLAMPSIEDITNALKRKQDNQDNVNEQAQALSVGAVLSYEKASNEQKAFDEKRNVLDERRKKARTKPDAEARAKALHEALDEHNQKLRSLLSLRNAYEDGDLDKAMRIASTKQRVLQDALQLPIDLEICTKRVGS